MTAHNALQPSEWVQRWSHLVRPHARVLDVACGAGRHMQWFAAMGHHTTGVDRSDEALATAGQFGRVVCADIEAGAWPFTSAGQILTFDVVVVTNYLWRPLLPTLLQSLAPGGLLLYETFAVGNESVGKPSRPDFLLQAGELLQHCRGLRVLAFEDGFLDTPARFVQRIAAIQPTPGKDTTSGPERHLLSLK
jgi:SAM-dependent methyltransferase